MDRPLDPRRRQLCTIFVLALASSAISVDNADPAESADKSKEELFGRVQQLQAEVEKQCDCPVCEQPQPPGTQKGGDAPGWQRTPKFLIQPYAIHGPLRWGNLPKKVQDEFTLNNTVRFVEQYFDEGFLKSDTSFHEWSDETIQNFTKAADLRIWNISNLSPYGIWANKAFLEAFEAHPVKGKSALVVGSQKPWVEGILISFQAGSITTVDFIETRVTNPKIRFVTVPEFEELDEKFDAIISYSSVEHDGLGRYGDPINPWGDIERMKKLRGLLNTGGKLYLGVPAGRDSVTYNAHRVYGPIRWALLTEGWELQGTYGGCQLKDCWRHWTFINQPINVLTAKD